MCCPDKPLVKDFLSLIDSFNFVQWVSGPTHEHGHTLDLVLSHGLSVFNLVICDNVVSDHMPVLFDAGFSCATVKSHAPSWRCRISAAFDQLCVPSDSNIIDTEELSSWFHSSC